MSKKSENKYTFCAKCRLPMLIPDEELAAHPGDAWYCIPCGKDNLKHIYAKAVEMVNEGLLNGDDSGV